MTSFGLMLWASVHKAKCLLDICKIHRSKMELISPNSSSRSPGLSILPPSHSHSPFPEQHPPAAAGQARVQAASVSLAWCGHTHRALGPWPRLETGCVAGRILGAASAGLGVAPGATPRPCTAREHPRPRRAPDPAAATSAGPRPPANRLVGGGAGTGVRWAVAHLDPLHAGLQLELLHQALQGAHARPGRHGGEGCAQRARLGGITAERGVAPGRGNSRARPAVPALGSQAEQLLSPLPQNKPRWRLRCKGKGTVEFP